MEVALITGAFLLVLGYAMFEAWMDFERIEQGEDIDHVEGWVVRAIITSYLWVVVSFKVGWDALPCAIGSAFLFSAVFRYWLNGMRGKDWRYIAPWSAVYDCFWMTLQLHIEAKAWQPWRYRWPNKWQLAAFKAFYIEGSPAMVYSIHRAGTIAYITEFTITAACVLWVVLT